MAGGRELEFVWWLSEVLSSCRSFECLKVHDKIYSILGVLLTHSLAFPSQSIYHKLRHPSKRTFHSCDKASSDALTRIELCFGYQKGFQRFFEAQPSLVGYWLLLWQRKQSIYAASTQFGYVCGYKTSIPGFSFTQTTLRCYGAQFDTVDEVQLGHWQMQYNPKQHFETSFDFTSLCLWKLGVAEGWIILEDSNYQYSWHQWSWKCSNLIWK